MDEPLDRLYKKINQQGRIAIQCRNEQIDPWLGQLRNDHRRSLTLIATVPAHVSRNIKMCLQGMEASVPELYYYPSSAFHLTIMDLYRGYPSDQLLDDYVSQLQPLVNRFLPVQWRMQGLIVSSGAVLVKGFYSSSLGDLRNQLRQQIPLANLPLMERYQTSSGHMTIARFPTEVQHRAGLLKYVEQNSNLQFGTFEVNQLDLVIHDWYHRRVQSVATFSNT
ncbi:hypothetical protein HMPREF0501_00505 [Limosilactobacillus coleohominis 101-4-CHN]|uniref:DUF1868 domain-containing protein n=1 Tax=Limosilactobacillus coleohominis 101-4-CHN TaxID=575594 RepID=C7XUY9_9LACO|nr:2'-5' RNA ligase family protein [Limosilactobacillus coleohominis]EEU31100.1 hypothetical protein HMPREF0501_00505 [Limosilactobacillus coleohominis 101-4-CHN]